MSPRHGLLKSLVLLMTLSIGLAGRCSGSSQAEVPQLEEIQASRAAPQVFATRNYALTFRVPPHAFYCPLPESWAGSDHGTVIFLESPGKCGGNGYTSSSRGFERDVARVEIYYELDLSEDDGSPVARPRCEAFAHWRFLTRRTAICKTTEDESIILTAEAKYMTYARARAVFRLVTSASRFTNDVATFRTLVAAASQCCVVWKHEDGRTERYGTGHPCPSGANWF